MTDRQVELLLVEDNPGDARLIQEAIKEAAGEEFRVVWVNRLSAALDRIRTQPPGVVLLDLSLPDSTGFDTFVAVRRAAADVPIVLLTGLDDEELAVTAVREGAQDYLVKGQVSQNAVVRAIRYAIERQRAQAQLREMSLIDELTGLYNRRGLVSLGQERLRLAAREAKTALLLFIDLDGMKWINDNLGHAEGDFALQQVAAVLRQTFRDCDLIARIGGDEFVVLATAEPGWTAAALVNRLLRNVASHNAQLDKPYELSISVGAASCEPGRCCSVEDLIAQADKEMYRDKRSKHYKTIGRSLPARTD